MGVPFRAFTNPSSKLVNLPFGKGVSGIGRWHAICRVGLGDFLVEHAFRGVAADDDALFGESAFLRVEMKLRFALLFVRAVTGEAVVRQNRPDVPVEADRLGRRFV